MSRGLSLTEVAEATQISSSFLSIFETGKSDITVGRLVRLVKFFGVSIVDLIPDPEPQHTIVVRREGRRHLESRSEGAALELLTHHTRHTMLPVLGSLDPGGEIADEVDPQRSEFFMFMLAGAIEIDDRENEPVRLRKGDAAYYSTDRPRTFRNPGRTRAQWVGVQTPPRL
jgi:XRE family transcriptional regulator, regulator of sulfur utilization